MEDKIVKNGEGVIPFTFGCCFLEICIEKVTIKRSL